MPVTPRGSFGMRGKWSAKERRDHPHIDGIGVFSSFPGVASFVMPVRTATATWKGALRDGEGTYAVESGTCEGNLSFSKRFEDEPGSNPEELIGAAHAGCFGMAFSNELDQAGYTPNSVDTTAEVYLEQVNGGMGITRIHLIAEADVPDITEDEFQDIGQQAKQNCPVSQALAAVDEITLDATLV